MLPLPFGLDLLEQRYFGSVEIVRKFNGCIQCLRINSKRFRLFDS